MRQPEIELGLRLGLTGCSDSTTNRETWTLHPVLIQWLTARLEGTDRINRVNVDSDWEEDIELCKMGVSGREQWYSVTSSKQVERSPT